MLKQRSKISVIIVILTLWGLQVGAQSTSKVNWITFEELADSLRAKPKKVFIDFYTDWCAYCRKMDKQVFTNPKIAQKLNTDYYAVRMDAETRDTIHFDGQAYVNQQAQTQRRGFHELALLLGQRSGEFVLPTLLVLNEQFQLEHRRFQYLHSKQLLKLLE